MKRKDIPMTSKDAPMASEQRNDKIHGEGNYKASREYNEAT